MLQGCWNTERWMNNNEHKCQKTVSFVESKFKFVFNGFFVAFCEI